MLGASDSDSLSDDLETFSDSERNSDSDESERTKLDTKKSLTKSCAKNNVSAKHVEHYGVAKRTAACSDVEACVSAGPVNNVCVSRDSKTSDKVKCVVDKSSSCRSSVSLVENFGRQSSIVPVENVGQKELSAPGKEKEVANSQHEWKHFMGSESGMFCPRGFNCCVNFLCG